MKNPAQLLQAFHADMGSLVRYEKVEIFILGVVTPVSIFIWITMLLLEGKSVFLGRGQLVYFYGVQSYLVSTLWAGAILGLTSRFLFRYTLFKREKAKLTICYRVSLFLFSVGLLSSIWFTFSA